MSEHGKLGKPLTLDELRDLTGQPVWCVDGMGHSCWCLVSGFYEETDMERFKGAVDSDTGEWDGDYYGMTGDGANGLHENGWLAYRKPPEEPIPLEELMEMDGWPVYIVRGNIHGWTTVGWGCSITSLLRKKTHMYFCVPGTVLCEPLKLMAKDYGSEWNAYRNPPEMDMT